MRQITADRDPLSSAVIGLICGEFIGGAAVGGFPSPALKPPLTFQYTD
jgi:hypothetical protein